MANDRLDIIIFGATGYTGKCVVKNVVRFCKEQNMKFGVAGRKKETLEAVVNEFASDCGKIKLFEFDLEFKIKI